MSGTADDATIPRDAVVFVALSRGIGGPAQSLLTVLERLAGDHDRILYAPPGDLAFARRDGRAEATIDLPFDVRRCRPWEELNELSRRLDIELPGRVRDVRQAYARCDIVLCPSRKESFGRIAAEAMTNGLPVVASDIPAFRQLVGESGAGLLFPLDDPAAAGAAIRRLADDPDLRHEMGQRGREHVQRYTPQRVVPQLEDLYQRRS